MADVHGYAADPAEVEAVMTGVDLGDAGEDPEVRYARASAALALYTAVAKRIAEAREAAVLELYRRPGSSYQTIADDLLLGSRARAQQIIERAREREAEQHAG
jgi:hypothetical protein